jgi:hypothetical protein
MLVLAALVVFAGAGSVSATPQPVVPGADTTPQVSPNGTWLLFYRLYGGSRYTAPDTSLRIARVDGTGERELVARRRSLVALWTPENLIEAVLPQDDGTFVTTLRRPEDGAIVRQLPFAPAAWSPDGNWVGSIPSAQDLGRECGRHESPQDRAWLRNGARLVAHRRLDRLPSPDAQQARGPVRPDDRPA